MRSLSPYQATRNRRVATRPLLARDYAARRPVERLIEHLHGLGARCLAEFLAELGQEHRIAADIICKLRVYRRLDANTLALVGADRFAVSPIRAVGDLR